jgi:ADP-ribosyl-[dinitrogen reductase] hydrolase
VTPPRWQATEDRARAAFLGVAIGDALGATTEFMTPNEIKAAYGVHRKIVGGGWLYLKPGRVTDDTEMSICIARGILETGTWDLSAIADRFADWMRNRPVDIGTTCARGIRAYIQTGSLTVPYSPWSAGNGAVMRMAPVALFTLGNRRRLEALSLEQAHLTHNHPLSDAACITVGKMVQEAILGAHLHRLKALALSLVSRHPIFRFSPYPGRSSAYVVDTLQTVFHHLFSSATFEDCLIGIVNQGGDADTTGAIAGMIAGPLYGADTIPRQWLKRLNPAVRSEVEDLASRLVRRSPTAHSMKTELRLYPGTE